MNCRVKTLISGLLFIAAICVKPVYVVAQDSDLTSYPPLIFKTMSRLSKWSENPQATEQCKLTFSSPKLSPEKCQTDEWLNPLDSFKSKLFFNFDISDSQKFKKEIFELKPGLKIRGLLAVHENQKRPLVIFRMGIHGNIDEFLAERFFMKLIYENLGYHVLALESLTSHGYLKLNDRVTIGGVEEGLHTFFILNKITHSQFSWANDVTDIHLVGVSMSGAGILLTTYLDEQNEHRIKSTQAFCPLINLEKTFEYHSRPGLFSAFLDLWNSRRLKALYDKNPSLNEIPLWKIFFDLKPRFTPAALEWINHKEPQPLLDLQTFKNQFTDVRFSPDFVQLVDNSKSFYQLNDFWPLFKNQKTPIKIYVTPNDPAVVNFLNTDLIRNGRQPGDFSKTQIMDLKGVHCGLASVYQWPFLVEMLKRGFEGR
jgi:hypothetical protein